MGMFGDSFRKWSAFLLGWTVMIVMTVSTLGYSEQFSTLPYIGSVFSNPALTLAVCFAFFILMFRGNALPRFFYSLFKPSS
jgi:phosphoglycerol transferase MdoB-like AlkP superfamily enzyme